MFREPFPILHVDDVERSSRFYCDAFGFEQVYAFPDEGSRNFSYLKLGETGIGLSSKAEPQLPDWPRGRGLGAFELCMYSDDTDAAAKRLREHGVRQVTASREMPWGEKLAFFEDPDGNLLHVTAVVGDGA